MKYETLKRNVADLICFGIERGASHQGHVALFAYANRTETGADAWESMKELSDACRRIVMAWDVRCVGKLRELFPNSFPRSLRTGPLVADLDNNKGDWVVYSAIDAK